MSEALVFIVAIPLLYNTGLFYGRLGVRLWRILPRWNQKKSALASESVRPTL